MTTWPSHDYAAQPATVPRAHAEDLVNWHESLRRAGHACCCTASPSVVVIMPPARGRPAVDLLFCQHHYRVHGQALAAAGALALDQDGEDQADDAGTADPGEGQEDGR